MSILRANVDIDRSEFSDFWFRPVSSRTKSGKTVNEAEALSLSALYQGVRIIAETLAGLPRFVFEFLEQGKGKARNHPVQELISRRPNNWQNSFEWFELSGGHAVLQGNAYSEIVPGTRGFADVLRPLRPDRVDVQLLRDGTVRYLHWDKDRNRDRVIPQEQVLHIRGGGGGLKGLPLLLLMAEDIGLSLAQREHAARWFGNGTAPSGVLEHPKTLSPEAQDRLKKNFNNTYSGISNHHSVMLLEEGMEWKAIGVDATSAQLLESRKFMITTFARWLRVPPHMLADLERATFSNIENQSIMFVRDTILPWVRRFEQALLRSLILEPDRFFVGFVIDGLLRGNFQQRMRGYQISIQNGILSRNEVRELEDRNPYEGGDVMIVPKNMELVGATQNGKRSPAEALAAHLAFMAAVEKGNVKLLDGDDTELEERTEADKRAMSIVSSTARRAVAKELRKLKHWGPRYASDRDGWVSFLHDFYGRSKHQAWLSETLGLGEPQAEHYCTDHRRRLMSDGLSVAKNWENECPAQLVQLAVGEAA